MDASDSPDEQEHQPEHSDGGSVIRRYSNAEWAQSQFGIPDEKIVRFDKLREQVYQRRFGEAKNVSHEIIPLVPHIDVMEYYRTGKNGQVCTLVTSGMSNLAMNAPPQAEARRVELIFYCKESRHEYIDTMRWLAHFPHDQKTWIGPYHTMPNGNPPVPLWDNPTFDTLFFMPSIVKADSNLPEELVFDNDGVHFLWIVPLTPAECKLKLAKGADAILDLFQANRHPHVFDPNRKSYV